MAARGGSKGKAGGKGGPTGGKGPAAGAGTLAEVGAEDDHWAGDMLGGAIAGAAAEFDEWDFAHAAVCSLRADTETFSGKTAGASASTRLAQPFSGRTYKTFAGAVVATLAAGTPAIATKNSFDALSLLTDDAEQLLALPLIHYSEPTCPH